MSGMFFRPANDTVKTVATAAAMSKEFSSVTLNKNAGSTNEALSEVLGGRYDKNSRDVDVAAVVGKKVDAISISARLLQLKYHHEQNGGRYLFEARLNEMLKQGHNVDARAAKDFLVGLLNSGKFDNLPAQICTNLVKLSEIPAVRSEFANEKVSVFNPKPHGFNLNLGYRPS